jgi:hypothetical protein
MGCGLTALGLDYPADNNQIRPRKTCVSNLGFCSSCYLGKSEFRFCSLICLRMYRRRAHLLPQSARVRMFRIDAVQNSADVSRRRCAAASAAATVAPADFKQRCQRDSKCDVTQAAVWPGERTARVVRLWL